MDVTVGKEQVELLLQMLSKVVLSGESTFVASSILGDPFFDSTLDRNGIMRDNILELLPYMYAIYTTQELSVDPMYDSKENKSCGVVGSWERNRIHFFSPFLFSLLYHTLVSLSTLLLLYHSRTYSLSVMMS